MKPPYVAARSLAILAALGVCAGVAHAQVAVRSPLADDREASPGETYEGTVLVRNESSEPRQAKLYQSDYLFFADGSNRYDAPGTTARSNAAWVELVDGLVPLAPGETVPVTYRVRVPEGVEGTYWSLLMVEDVPAGSAESTLGEDPVAPLRYGMRQVTRYGVQVATHVRGSGVSAVTFADVRLRSDGDRRVLEVDLRNDGTRLARSRMWAEIYDASGVPSGRRDGEVYRLYPETSARQRIDLSDLVPGLYEVLLIVDVGEDLVGAQYTLEL